MYKKGTTSGQSCKGSIGDIAKIGKEVYTNVSDCAVEEETRVAEFSNLVHRIKCLFILDYAQIELVLVDLCS